MVSVIFWGDFLKKNVKKRKKKQKKYSVTIILHFLMKKSSNIPKFCHIWTFDFRLVDFFLKNYLSNCLGICSKNLSPFNAKSLLRWMILG